MLTYIKLFSTLLDSSVWCEPDPIRILWITMMAKADAEGIVRGSVPGLANHARIAIADCRQGLAKFLAPDPDSTSQEYKGRRIEEVPGGWRLLNHARYREMLSLEARREYHKKRQSEYRQRLKDNRENKVAAEILAEKRKVRDDLEGNSGYILHDSPKPYPQDTTTNTPPQQANVPYGTLPQVTSIQSP